GSAPVRSVHVDESADRGAHSHTFVTHPGMLEFRALFDAERDRILRFLVHLTGNRSDAEDLLQETFIAVWRQRDQFEGRGSAAGYLRRTAFHLFLNARQKQARRNALAPASDEEPVCTPVADFDEREAREVLLARVRSAVDGLPEGPREAFILFRFEGHTCAEIAEIMRTPKKTVESRLARAIELLNQRLKRHAPELSTE
ncbi:MAG TPA: RNA polymerase sigma factor, partial [Planctomycetota bacterium]|nr:RNA polymerase sigma factor [Planctomycetota bacterium]